MKALSLWQPWASLMAAGGKTPETRGWPTAYRGPLAIHAAKRPMDAETRQLYLEWIEDGVLTVDLGPLPYGAIVAVVDLVDCIHTEDVAVDVFKREWDFGDFGPGRWAWVTRNPRRVGPIPWRGAQGLFEIPDGVIEGRAE